MRTESKLIMEVMKECGKIMTDAVRENLHISSKEGLANFVTEYDTKVQEVLRKKLLQIVPEAVFIGEEGEQNPFCTEGKFFIVDPIDGTTNFIKDYHMSCISVAFIENGTLQLAFVYNPYLDEMYWAEQGQGAYCNERKLHVSTQPLSNGIVLFGTSPYHEELNEASFRKAFEYFKKALDIRRSGSAALDLCAIAAGRAELYFELILSPWDYAAGALLVEEAGGKVTTVDGEKIWFDKPCSILARGNKVEV